jgi:hypothetical protein
MLPFAPTTNTELTAGLPITQDIMRRLRDDGYSKLPDSGQTNETDTSKSLAPDGAGGVQWKIAPTAPQNVVLVTASGSVSIPAGTRIKLTVIGGGGGGAGIGGSSGTAGGDTTATDGTTTVVGGYGGNSGGGNGTSSGGTGYTIPNDGGESYGYPGSGPVGGYYGKGGGGGNGGSSANAGGGNGGQARVVSMVMASGTLTVTIGAGGAGGSGATYPGHAGHAGAVIVEY